MEVTLTIDDDVLAVVEDIAARQQRTIGEVLSSLSRQSMPKSQHDLKARNDIPLLPKTANSQRVTFEMVESLKDELLK